MGAYGFGIGSSDHFAITMMAKTDGRYTFYMEEKKDPWANDIDSKDQWERFITELGTSWKNKIGQKARKHENKLAWIMFESETWVLVMELEKDAEFYYDYFLLYDAKTKELLDTINWGDGYKLSGKFGEFFEELDEATPELPPVF